MKWTVRYYKDPDTKQLFKTKLCPSQEFCRGKRKAHNTTLKSCTQLISSQGQVYGCKISHWGQTLVEISETEYMLSQF